ncbi:DNA mismatch repair protein MutS [Aminipila butyrica]|uniref:DNA mismatch repair protein MutS n=1 Tax=Aminipila butyrica TaxID=433296 RepID=A0A858BXH2_9FIRM|nr:DNA mismatch repair protein MutS [Aminipila butyrica]QIB69414.1 DNA mismatch repair protein MutS [Aminipila butyrica]
MQLTPMMQQYMEIKQNHQDCILFFRLGDFYEMFFEDAITASREMEITLTGKNCGQEERAPMCGVPFHSVDTYIAKLVDKGYKVAICEQVEDPATAKGIVKREVVQIVTPGTIISQTMLNEKENNYLASIYLREEGAGISYCDISTGELHTTSIEGSDTLEILLNELVKIKAKEVIINQSAENFVSLEEMKKITDAYFNPLPESYHNIITANDAILKQFQTKSLTGLGLDGAETACLSLGALLSYLFETRKHSLSHITQVMVYDIGSHMSLDKSTIRNLEITETLYEKRVQGSLLGILDKTHTAMGSRKMKQWLREPLNSSGPINQRLDAVEALGDQIILRNNIKECLKKVYDLERLAGRIACGNANGKDLIALGNSLFILPELKAELASVDNPLLASLNQEISIQLMEVYELIEQAVVEEPPFTIKEGGIIKAGFSKELDDLRFSIKDGQTWIAELEGKERERTGIKNLKVRFNKVFGYYIEITKSNLDMAPEDYIRKQTLVNCERFITPELKEMESLVLHAESKINQMEYEIFAELRSSIQEYIGLIQKASGAISTIDVLTSFAHVSAALGYVKPEVNDSGLLNIRNGRHPVIEEMIRDGIFVSNDVYVNDSDASMLLITGPNMAGKSTYMRQTALIVLMAQAGCFVPCESAAIGVVDRIYTRIGASDNLAQGQSTFFVEMSELAYILNTATDKSLIILDEIGRGTSTYDGLSIAWAVVEYLCNEKNKIRTLFATHYHELTALEELVPGVKNLNVDVAEENGNIVFLHKIVSGSASKSYGIHVAKIAGVPKMVLEAAENKLTGLEGGQDGSPHLLDAGKERKESSKALEGSDRNKALGDVEEIAESLEQLSESHKKQPIKEDKSQGEQLSLFSFAPNPVIQRLKSIDLMKLAPWEALKILAELQEAAND